MNVTDKSELRFKLKNNSDSSPNTNKIKYKRHWVKIKNYKKLRNVYDLLLCKNSLSVEPKPPLALTNTPVSNNNQIQINL